VLPHVAAVAAVYGDPAGKYAAFLSKTTNGKYKTQSYFFYDQPDAFVSLSCDFVPALTGETF
jgi:hypothetical protein